MATLTIRGVDDKIHQALRERAAANGRSMEAEVRAMLVERVGPQKPKESGAEALARIRARLKGLDVELELPERERLGPPMDFPGWEELDDAEDDDAA